MPVNNRAAIGGACVPPQQKQITHVRGTYAVPKRATNDGRKARRAISAYWAQGKAKPRASRYFIRFSENPR